MAEKSQSFLTDKDFLLSYKSQCTDKIHSYFKYYLKQIYLTHRWISAKYNNLVNMRVMAMKE